MGDLFLAITEEERFLERHMTPEELQAFATDRIAYTKGRTVAPPSPFDVALSDAKRKYERQFDDFLSDLKTNNSPSNKDDHE